MAYVETNSLSEHILASLMSAKSVRSYHRILREMRIERYKREQICNTLSRMNKRGLIEKSGTGWQISKTGRQVLENKNRLNYIPSPFAKSELKNNIVAFDIPENHRRERVWLREQLKVFGYEMLQKSLWRGPGPLPKEFLERLKVLQIDKGVKTFKIVGRKL